jgi:hypothetical protein
MDISAAEMLYCREAQAVSFSIWSLHGIFCGVHEVEHCCGMIVRLPVVAIIQDCVPRPGVQDAIKKPANIAVCGRSSRGGGKA